MPVPDPLPNVAVRGIQLSANMQLRFQVLPRMFGSPEKSRNYRRVFLDLVFFADATGSVVLNILRVNPFSGSQQTVKSNHSVSFSSAEVKTTRIELESTYGGYWIYSIHVDSLTAGVDFFLVGAWLCIDEHYDYGSDVLLN